MIHFQNICLLITHYNRSKSLERLLASLHQIGCSFGEVLIADDGSKKEHIDYIELELSNLYSFRLVKSPVNKGLGHNLNLGQTAVTKPFVLYIQEDFEPSADFPQMLQLSEQYMQEDERIDMTRFFAHYRYPYLKPFVRDERFSISYFSYIARRYDKIYNYSDLPHLRRKDFAKKFGKFREGIAGDRTEYWMCISFIKKRGVVLFYNDFRALFQHVNNDAEPSTMSRKRLSTSQNFFVKSLRLIYRQLRYNYDIFLTKIR